MFSPPLQLAAVPPAALESEGWVRAQRHVCVQGNGGIRTLKQLGFSVHDALVCNVVGLPR